MIEVPLARVGDEGESHVTWDDLNLEAPWSEVVQKMVPAASVPSDVQVQALVGGELLTSRRNLLISGPTNSGKSLLAYLAMLRGASGGKRVLLLEPLRAIAQEKFEELSVIVSEVADVLGAKLGVTITTGDYRLDEETMQAPPPEGGEIVIATPERIEAILRNPDFDSWVSSIGVVCADEAHLLADRIRGATLEYVLTSFRVQATPPRLVLLSATLGDPAPLTRWLEPCDLIQSEVRRPPLSRSILQVDKDEDTLHVLATRVGEILRDPQASVLVFVYQTSWATSLAKILQEALGDLCGSSGAAAYHSRMSSATRADVRAGVASGAVRCVVSTTALAMGVNLPTTHVIVRDLTHGPKQPIPASGLIQMMGRAGRGNRAGHSSLVLRPGDPWSVEDLKRELESSNGEKLESALLGSSGAFASPTEPPLAKIVLSFLSRRPESCIPLSEVEKFVEHTMGGAEATHLCQPALRWLSNPSQLLAFEEEEGWKSTRLGQAAIRASLPLQTAGGLAQLMRDILFIDPEDALLSSLSPLDLLLLIELVAARPMLRKPFSENLAEQIDGWASRSEIKSSLFNQWVRGGQGFSKAAELLGSLGVGNGRLSEDAARKLGYQAMLRAILLWQLGNGALPADMERRWRITEISEIQESWRDDRLFLIGAMKAIWEIPCFYFHLREECHAADERIHRVKRAFQRMKGNAHRLMSLLSWCSPLGPVFLKMRSLGLNGSKRAPAKGTMRMLEDAGITTIQGLRDSSLEQLRAAGVPNDLGSQLLAFARRRR